MTPNRIHLISHANPLAPDIKRFGMQSVEQYVAFARQHLPKPFRITCDMRILNAVEDEWHGGRTDDARRIRDLNAALADPKTHAIVASNGGGYLARILPHLDFSPLTKRETPLWATGFSELSGLVNIIASYRAGRGLYWLCPNWLGWKIDPIDAARDALAEFWHTLPDVLGGVGVSPGGVGAGGVGVSPAASTGGVRVSPGGVGVLGGTGVPPVNGEPEHLKFGPIVGELVQGKLAGIKRVRLVGGCLAVLAALVGSPLARRFRPDNKWLILEDIKENPYRVDRYLATLKLAGWFDRLAGLIIGDFRMMHGDTQPAVLELLPYHLPANRKIPIITTRSFGHVWPMVPVLLNQPLPLRLRGLTVEIG